MAMVEYAWQCVHRAKERGYSIVVGDAEGIDLTVILSCLSMQVPFETHGITPQARCLHPVRASYANAQLNYHQHNTNFLGRDRVMVNRADMVIAVWNGASRGTKYTYDYAVKQGKEAHLKTFN